MIYNTYDNDEEGDLKRQKLSNPISMISRQYSSFQNNPRIVRVSQQAFGGKDRHSKVWTIKGVRDRRIRLSIPTAIQLYHLQHQLGLTQPSKVIDWLLDVTKRDIDKLPPLQIAPQDYNRFHPQTIVVPHNFNSFAPFSNTTDHDNQGKEAVVSFSPIFNSTTPNYDHHQRTQGKQIMIENKWNSYNYYDDHNLSSSAPSFEPRQILSCFSSHNTTPTSFFPPYHHVMPALELLSSNSPQNSLVPSQPLNLIDTDQVKVIPFGLSMYSRVSSGSNGMG